MLQRFPALTHYKTSSFTQNIKKVCWENINYWFVIYDESNIHYVRKVESNNWASTPPKVWSLDPPPGRIMHTELWNQSFCERYRKIESKCKTIKNNSTFLMCAIHKVWYTQNILRLKIPRWRFMHTENKSNGVTTTDIDDCNLLEMKQTSYLA